MIEFVAAELDHVPAIAEAMRPDDVREVTALGRTPHDALAQGLRVSLWALTAMKDGKPEAMMGVAPRSMIEGSGVPWMLGSEAIYDAARALATYAPRIIGQMRASFDRLQNVVAADNHRAIAFLKHYGFEFYGDVTHLGDVEFLRFRNRV